MKLWRKAEQIQEETNGPNGEDYNRFDSETLEAVNYWNDFFSTQKHSPPQPLDPNLVKAIIYVESRAGYGSSRGYPAYPDVMQVGNPADPALHVLNNDGEWPTEFEAYNGKVKAVDYKGKANANTPYESIYWGVRWLYHKAKNIETNEKQVWYSWKKATQRYGPGTETYLDKVWSLYSKGKSPDEKKNLFF